MTALVMDHRKMCAWPKTFVFRLGGHKVYFLTNLKPKNVQQSGISEYKLAVDKLEACEVAETPEISEKPMGIFAISDSKIPWRE